jgi:hypothetical protein
METGMNIFILDKDPVIAAQLQCDKHVVKMIVESAQMLSTAHRMLDGTIQIAPSKSGKRMVKHYRLFDDAHLDETLYKAVHYKHPCTVWTMESNLNYDWHWIHFKALCDEYTYRYGKVHSSERLLQPLRIRPKNIPKGKLTPFKLAMKANPECMLENAVLSYRAFYQTKQDRFKMVWTKRSKPGWFQEKYSNG